AFVYDDCVLGHRVIIHSGAVVGTDGYGFATHKGEHHKIPQIGNVIVEDDVEIGSCCSIERAALGSTVIGKGTKIDQLVVVGHGSKIGPHCLLVAQSGIAGSVTLGHHVTLAGQTGVSGHLKIGNQVTVGAQSGIISDIEDQQTVVGSPAMPVSHAPCAISSMLWRRRAGMSWRKRSTATRSPSMNLTSPAAMSGIIDSKRRCSAWGSNARHGNSRSKRCQADNDRAWRWRNCSST